MNVIWVWELGCAGLPFLVSDSSGLQILSGGVYNMTIWSFWGHKNIIWLPHEVNFCLLLLVVVVAVVVVVEVVVVVVVIVVVVVDSVDVVLGHMCYHKKCLGASLKIDWVMVILVLWKIMSPLRQIRLPCVYSG